MGDVLAVDALPRQVAPMGEIVNLRGVRRQRDRQAQALAAADNRSRHGRTRAEKARDENDAARQRAILDGARIEPNAPPPDSEPSGA